MRTIVMMFSMAIMPVKDGGESVILGEESINIVGKGSGHLEFERLEE